jgi:hypothetical protein
MIIRRRHTANFTTISNVVFDDGRLAADEVGILTYLLSRPHNWEVRRPALMKRWGIGEHALKRIIRGLMRTGWCQASKVRLPNGTFCINYEISDQPGRELNDEEITEALSLVSAEASGKSSSSDLAAPAGDNHPPLSEPPPPNQPGVGQPRVADWGVVYITNTDSPNTELKRDDSGGPAPALAFTPGSKALADAFWKALGFENPLEVPPEFAGVDWRAVKWEQAGWTVDLITSEARRIARDLPLKPITYFEKVFATSFAKRQAPLPLVEVKAAETLTVTTNGRQGRQGGSTVQAVERLIETIGSFGDAGSEVTGVCGQASAPAVRKFPAG